MGIQRFLRILQGSPGSAGKLPLGSTEIRLKNVLPNVSFKYEVYHRNMSCDKHPSKADFAKIREKTSIHTGFRRDIWYTSVPLVLQDAAQKKSLIIPVRAAALFPNSKDFLKKIGNFSAFL